MDDYSPTTEEVEIKIRAMLDNLANETGRRVIPGPALMALLELAYAQGWKDGGLASIDAVSIHLFGKVVR